MLKKILVTTLFLVGSLLADDPDRLLNFSVGSTWPQSDYIKSSPQTAVWNGSAEWGMVFDNIITIGARVDFSWHLIRYTGEWNTTTSAYESSNSIYKKDRTFMIPLSIWLGVDPVPQYRFHPVLHAQIGYNSLFRHTKTYAGISPTEGGDFKYYKGFYSKFGIDGMFDLGPSASIFAGFEYQVAPVFYKNRDTDQLIEENYSAPIVRIGVSFLY